MVMKQVHRLVAENARVLRKFAQPFSFDELRLESTAQLIQDMQLEMHDQYGIGIAAPQVGVDKRLFIAYIPHHISDDVKALPQTLFFNPVVATTSLDQFTMYESCLSVPDKIGKVQRYNNVVVNYFDEHGSPQNLTAEGFIAAVIQHENDHLNGILYTDRIEDEEKDLWDVDEFFKKHMMPLERGTWEKKYGHVDIKDLHLLTPHKVLLQKDQMTFKEDA